MIIDAAFEIARSEGAENINARTVSKKLGCSTQPVMYHFKTIEELKKTVYVKADEYHSEYITNIQSENPMKDIGLNYIRFAETEKNLFRFLFQTNEFIGKNISELINSEELQPIIAILSKEVEVNTEQAKTIFRSLFLIAHGYASMFANNEMTYDEQTIISDLDLVFDGTCLFIERRIIMYRLYKKNELNFSLIWIISYVVLFSVADSFSASLGTEKIIAAPVAIVFTLLLLVFVSKHNLKEKYGLCSFNGSLRNFLYFTPLLLIMSINLWNGVTMKLSVLETVLYILSMLCVGFIEEIIFRGFLFKALYNDNVKLAIVISSVTFGIGHIVNLLNGKDLIPTLLQVCYAIAIGFLFTIIFYKGKSLLPCIIAHSFVNSSSVFAVENSSMKFHIISSAVLCIISLSYALWILKKTKQFDEYSHSASSRLYCSTTLSISRKVRMNACTSG